MTAGADAPQPALVIASATGVTRAVALLLPGGRADSYEPSQSRQLSTIRMRPIARAIHHAGHHDGLATWLLRYRYRGWNGADMSPVRDAQWALSEVRRQHGDVPVVLVGHSMGGRTALRVAGDDCVRGVVALAPWLLDTEPVDQLAGRRVLIVHGDLDKVTSPKASRRYAERARATGVDVDYISIRGETHAMVLRFPTWHRLTTSFVRSVIAP